MPNTILTFHVRDRQARAAFDRLQKEVTELGRDSEETNKKATRGLDALQSELNQTARAYQNVSRAEQGFGEFAILAASEFVHVLGNLHRQFALVTGGIVRAAANMETYRATLQSVTGNAEETNRVLNRLLGLTVSLVGIDTGALIQYAARLQAAGLSAADAEKIIAGLTMRIAEQGKSSATTNRVLEQAAQAINANVISQQDLRPILREIPTLYQDFSAALGTTITNLDDIRNAADAVGGPTQALILGFSQMAEASRGADLSTLNAQIDILQDSTQVLAAELGEHLVPAVVEVIKQVNAAIQWFQDLDDTAQAAIAWTAALATGLTGLGVATGTVVVALGALNLSLASLTGTTGFAAIGNIGGRVAGILSRIGSVAGLAGTSLITLGEAWIQIYNDFQRTAPFEDAVETLQAINLATSETARSFGVNAQGLANVSGTGRRDIELLISRADELRNSIRNLINAGGDRQQIDALRTEYQQITQNLQQLLAEVPTAAAAPVESLEVQLVRATDQVLRLQQAFRDTPTSVAAVENAARALTAAIQRERDIQLQNEKLTEAERLNITLSAEREIAQVKAAAEKSITAIVAAETEEQHQIFQRLRDTRIAVAAQARDAEVQAFQDAAQSGAEYAEQLEKIASLSQRRAFFEYVNQLVATGQNFDEARQQAERFFAQITAIPRAAGPDAAYGNFTSQLRRDFQETERQGQSLLDVMRQIANFTTARFDLDARIPDPDIRETQIDERIAAEARGQQTLNAIRQDAREQGRQFLDNIISSEERAVQASLRKQARSYRQFANLVSNTFINLATGRAENFEQVATAFIQQSLRIVLRAYVEYQIQKRLDDSLTTSKIANIQKVNAAQQAGVGIGNLPGLANLPGIGNLGNLLSGGVGALGVAGLLFPNESSNLLSGIKNEISGFLSNVAEVPDRAFGAQQVYLRIGEGEIRDITDIQDELREEDRV